MALQLLAFDLGASSGRGMLGRLDGGTLTLQEVSRFENQPVALADGLYWDVLRLFHEIKTCLTETARVHGRIDGIAVDTWGVDFGLLDEHGALLANPRHYRDALTADMPEAAFAVRDEQSIYDGTGLAFMPFNTLYQLYAMRRAGSVALANARQMLFMPDLLSYLLSGERYCEYTIASTSQMIDPYTRQYVDWLGDFGIDSALLPPIIEPGRVMGTLLPKWQEETGLGAVPIIAIAGHDTASAVAAVPATAPGFAYISSGTWSLLGCESDHPILSPAARAANYTNEGGVFGTIRALKNVMGLWIIQECKREWDAMGDEHTHGFAELAQMARESRPFLAQIDVDALDFFYPGDMPQKIAAYCQRTGQAVPQTKGEFARVIYESLALKYRWTLERQAEITGQRANALHIVGGGSKNALLNQLTADCLDMPVHTGPSEATAIGNLLMQAVALGEIAGLSELRDVVRRSFPPEVVQPDPQHRARWEDEYAKFCARQG